MKHHLLLIFAFFFISTSHAAMPELQPLAAGGAYANFTFHNVRYGVYRADPAKLTLHWKNAKGTPYAGLGTLRRSLEAEGKRVIFLTNAGIYSANDTPAGLWVENGQTLIPLNTRNGKGNFHVQPNGVFYIENGRAHIKTTATYQMVPHHPQWAFQSGPILILDGQINRRFNQTHSSPHKRNAVCTTGDGGLYFILSENYGFDGEWPSLYRFAAALQHIGCTQALYLDGTLSTWYIPTVSSTFHWTHLVGIIAITDTPP